MEWFYVAVVFIVTIFFTARVSYQKGINAGLKEAKRIWDMGKND